jgi:hypothetical protein
VSDGRAASRAGADADRPRVLKLLGRYGRTWPGWVRIVAGMLAAVGVIPLAALLFFFVDWLIGGQADFREGLLCACLLAFSLVSYVAWPSRWNIVAHAQLAFGIAAYILPVTVLDRFAETENGVLSFYLGVMSVGATLAVVGAVLGARLSRTFAFPTAIVERVGVFASRTVPRRVAASALLALAALAVAFAVMGFIPAFAADPFDAKFFRNEYAAPYASVAPLYRASTTALMLLLPLLAMYAWWRRRLGWVLLFVLSLVALLVTLQREPALIGILLFLGVLIAMSGRWMRLYVCGLIAVYFAGSASYFVLAALGIGNYGASIELNPSDLFESVAAGAPDVADQIGFIRAWLDNPVYAGGRTFFGGLIPGGYEWNPSVWSLAVTNPGVDVSTISSGGLRLPGPLWGYVNLGWFGVAVVSLLYGAVLGYLAAVAARWLNDRAYRVAGRRRREHFVIGMVLYATVVDAAAQLYALSYITVIQVLIVGLLLVRVRLSWAPGAGQDIRR